MCADTSRFICIFFGFISEFWGMTKLWKSQEERDITRNRSRRDVESVTNDARGFITLKCTEKLSLSWEKIEQTLGQDDFCISLDSRLMYSVPNLCTELQCFKRKKRVICFNSRLGDNDSRGLPNKSQATWGLWLYMCVASNALQTSRLLCILLFLSAALWFSRFTFHPLHCLLKLY